MKQPYQNSPDRRTFRNALGEFATGVAVVTARTAGGQPVGVTINSFASVSLEPPLVLWSLGLQSPSLAVFEACSHYVVNILAADQTELSQRFS
ncbi:MAG: flavin reductase family protein, partial [Betaproteobacteria bacterium]|nr:flavin reductase family protein [Betaproteobacteria bacterium]